MDEGVLKDQALTLWMKGQKHHLRGDFNRAIELYTKSLALYPTAEAYTFRGWAYSFQGRLDEAIDECKKAIAVDRTFGNPYNDIGSYLVKKVTLDEASEGLEQTKTACSYEPRHSLAASISSTPPLTIPTARVRAASETYSHASSARSSSSSPRSATCRGRRLRRRGRASSAARPSRRW